MVTEPSGAQAGFSSSAKRRLRIRRRRARGRRLLKQFGESAHQIGAGDDPDKGIIAKYRQALDMVALHQLDDFSERGILSHADDIRRHDLANLSPVRADISRREPPRSEQKFQPPRVLPFSVHLGTTQQIALTQDANHFPAHPGPADR
jgi:hypothetical protein